MTEQPNYPPPKPEAVTGSCTVETAKGEGHFHVDLDTMTCDCERGAPWWQDRGEKWRPNKLCAHKLKAVASLATKTGDDTIRDFYEHQLGLCFNAFEVVSAFHKELRRGDTEKAIYWATMLIAHRGKHGIVTYMRNILFEETRDLNLARYILKISSFGKSVDILDVQRGVRRFCEAPKKWHLPWRVELYLDEMRGYQKLAKEYGYEVAKGKDIIAPGATEFLKGELLRGFAEGDRVTVQVGLKGWFKSQSKNHDHMKIDILNMLIEVMNGEHENAFEYSHEYAMAIYKLNMMRLRNHNAVGYHELNALCDALTGEPGDDPRATLPDKRHKLLVGSPKRYRPKLGALRRIPMYAHDNHTYGGKAKMRRFPEQLRPGAQQKDIDFRLCGAYHGVAWRMLAYAQHGTIDVPWSEVKWEPKWLWNHTDSMWY